MSVPEQVNLTPFPVNPILSQSQRINLAFLVGDHILTDGEQLYGRYFEYFQAEIEPLLLAAAMQRNHGNQSHTAKFLGLNRGTLRRKLKAYDRLHHGKA